MSRFNTVCKEDLIHLDNISNMLPAMFTAIRNLFRRSGADEVEVHASMETLRIGLNSSGNSNLIRRLDPDAPFQSGGILRGYGGPDYQGLFFVCIDESVPLGYYYVRYKKERRDSYAYADPW